MSSQLPSNIKPGSVIQNRNRLWRVDAMDGNVVTATPLDGNAADRHRFYTPVENITEGSLEPPDPEKYGLSGRAHHKFGTNTRSISENIIPSSELLP